MSYTKGKWKIRNEKEGFVESGACFDIDTIDDKHIGFVTRSTLGIDNDEVLSNARLIASAPELLEALKAMICASQNDNRGLYNARIIADQAIAKAEGKI